MSWADWSVSLRPAELIEQHPDQLQLLHHNLIASRLQQACRAYNSSSFNFVSDHFDTYLSVIINGNQLDWNTINKGFECIERACQSLCVQLEEFFQEKDLDSCERLRFLNCLKMLLYLFIELIKVKDVKMASQIAATFTIGRRKKQTSEDTQSGDSDWRESERRATLDILYNLLQLPLQRLWDPPLADDAFIDMVAQPCYRIMEDPIIKNKPTRETVFQTLGILCKKYNHGLSCTIKLVQMVQLYEHAVSPICAGICQLVSTWGLSGLVARLVGELGEALGVSGSSSEEGAASGPGDAAPAQRNCAHFLSELTQLMPAQMIPAAQAMRSYLENDECYPLRTSVLGMLCEILCCELKGEGLQEEKRIMRDEFLDDLTEHLLDLSAYVRAKVLQYWIRLQREGCVPITRQQNVLARAVGRLQDRATLVRKSAIQLVKAFLEHNPYSAELQLAHLEKQLECEKKNLENIQGQLNVETDNELVEKWEEIKGDVKSVIESKINQPTQDDVSLSQGSLNDSYGLVRRYLTEGKYYEAFLVVRDTEKQYPQAKLLRCELDRKDQVAYILALLRNVFITDITKLQDPSAEENINQIQMLEEKENVVAFLEDSVSFSKLIQQAIPLVYSLLMSKQSTDVNEAIDFFTTAHSFNIETANLGIMGMLQLVWSPDLEKRKAVEDAYRKMYLETEGNSERTQAAATATALVKLVLSVNRGQAAALQVLLTRWLESGHLSNTVLHIFWEMFAMKHKETTDEDSYAALSILTMIAKSKPSVASANIEVIQNVGLSSSYRKKVLSLQLLICMSQSKQRYPMTSPLFEFLSDCFVNTFLKSEKFASFGTNIINVIYALCNTPDLMCIQILSAIMERLNNHVRKGNDDTMSSYPIQYISRLLILLGNIAMQQLIYLDVTVYSELRRRNEIRDQRKVGAKTKSNLLGKKARKSDISFNSSSASAAGRLHRLHNQSVAVSNEDGEEVEEAGLEGAVADDADAELIRTVCDREVVCAGLLGRASSIIHNLLQGPLTLQNSEVRAAACLALGRFMLVSSTFCEENMQLLMSLLKSESCSTIRCNIVITLADLTLRFPNVIQPWTPHIYERLNDPCVEVRQCTVKMLSYLILQEMVRARGQVAGLAKCCVDSDPNTRTMARLFFKQLSQKGNALYNIIPDIISRLSDPTIGLPEDDFRTILKYVMSLIQKDRQMEALVEKLCLRFKLSNDERQWRDLAYCLSLFLYNERSIKKLIENMDCYKDKLFTKEVYHCFKTIITNTSKLAKPDLKAAVTELSDKIEENFAIRSGTNDDQNTVDENCRQKMPVTPRCRKVQRRPRTQKSNSGSDFESDDDIENVTPVKNKNQNNVRASARKRTPLKYQDNASEESDEDEIPIRKRSAEKNSVFKKPVGRASRKRK